MGTIGGNLCLDTRCTYYDQNYEWRKSIDFCMKKDGQTCWVATSSPKCLAVSSTDTAPMLQALGASVTLVSAARPARVAARGSLRQRRHPLPDQTPGRDPDVDRACRPPTGGAARTGNCGAVARSTSRWRRPQSRARLDGARVIDVRIVLGAVSSRPLEADRAAALLTGEELTDDAIAAAAAAASEVAKPMDNTDFELVWRKKMVRSLVGDALREFAATT